MGVRRGAVGEGAEHVRRHLPDEAGCHPRNAVRAVAEDRLHPAHGACVEDAGPACVRVVGRIAEARRPLAHQRRVGQDLDRPRHRVGGIDPVVLDADQVAEARPRGHPGPGEHPAVRGRHHVRSDRGIALVKRPDQRGLRIGTGRLAPVAGDQRVLYQPSRNALARNPDEVVETNNGNDSPVSTLAAPAYPSIACGDPRWRISQSGSPTSEFSETARCRVTRVIVDGSDACPAGPADRQSLAATAADPRIPVIPSAPSPRNARLLALASRVMAERMHRCDKHRTNTRCLLGVTTARSEKMNLGPRWRGVPVVPSHRAVVFLHADL